MSYNRVNWENSPSTRTPITAENLNKMDSAISRIDGDLTDAQNTLSDTVSRVDVLEDEIGTASNVFGGEFEYSEEYNIINVINEDITARMIEDGVVLMIIANQNYAIHSNAKIRINDAALFHTSQLNASKSVAKGDVLIISFTDNKYTYGLSSVDLSDVRNEIFSKSVLSATFSARDKDSTTTELYLNIPNYTPAPDTIILAKYEGIATVNLHERIALYINGSSVKYIGVRAVGAREVAKFDVLPIVLYDTEDGLSFNYADNWIGEALEEKVDTKDFIELNAEVQNKANRTELNEYMQKIYISTSAPATLTDSDNGILKNIKMYGKCVQTQPATSQSPQQIHSVVNPAIETHDDMVIDITADDYYYLDIKKGDTVILSRHITNGYGVSFNFYDENKNLVDYWQIQPNQLTREAVVSTTKDCKYVKIRAAENLTRDTYRVAIKGKSQISSVTLTGITLNAIPVSTGGNVTIDGQQYVADVVDAENGVIERRIKTITSDDYAYSIVNDPSHFLLNAPTTEPLPESIAQKLKWMMYSYAPITKISATSSDVTNFKCDAEYPVNLKKYIDGKMGNVETRIRQYDMDLSEPSEIAVWAVSAEKKG